MIRVFIERHVKPENREVVIELLKELRSACVRRRGYAGVETLLDPNDHSSIIVISTWATLSSWKLWEQSEERQYIYNEIRPLLTKEPTVRMCVVAATEEA
jgi:heme-degrading monooxygenase HmoA